MSSEKIMSFKEVVVVGVGAWVWGGGVKGAVGEVFKFQTLCQSRVTRQMTK